MPISEATNEDCMIMMARYPDRYFDLAIIDPPYGINIASAGKIGNCNPFGGKGTSGGKKSFGGNHTRKQIVPSKDYGKKKWDKDRPSDEYYEELYRVSENQIIFGANHIGRMKPSPGWIVWDKQNSGNYADCELAYTSFDVVTRIFQFRWNGMLQGNMSNKEERIHPTQKPVALYHWILQNYAKAGDKILDTHLGSGSSRIAAYKLGFDFWATELDKDYFDAQEKRFREAINEPLFQTIPDITQSKLFT
jgi:site-specific DNA-methyltransferase (adenine-specific)